MIPGPWVALVLALGAYRLTRLVGWDDFPLALRLRAWATGEAMVRGPNVHGENYTYRHPTLKKLITCPFCAGFHLSLVIYMLWLWLPAATLYGLAPFALSAAVGLIAKNLDP